MFIGIIIGGIVLGLILAPVIAVVIAIDHTRKLKEMDKIIEHADKYDTDRDFTLRKLIRIDDTINPMDKTSKSRSENKLRLYGR